MEKINNNGSGFQLKSIILVDSHMSRKPNVNFKALRLDVEIGTGVGVKDNVVNVKLSVNVKQMENGIEQSEMSATMVGTFEKTGETPLNDMEEFGRINGASIIFPFFKPLHFSDVLHIVSICPKLFTSPTTVQTLDVPISIPTMISPIAKIIPPFIYVFFLVLYILHFDKNVNTI